MCFIMVLNIPQFQYMEVTLIYLFIEVSLTRLCAMQIFVYLSLKGQYLNVLLDIALAQMDP